VCALVGVVIGAGSALAFESSDSDSGGYFKATNTVFFEPVGESGSTGLTTPYTNIDQIAFLTVQGDVPENAAQTLGVNETKLTEQVLVTANGTISTIEITAAGGNAQEAEQIADTFAEELIEDIESKDQAYFDEQLDDILQRSDDIQQDINELDSQLAAGPNEIIEAERDALVNQYRLSQESLSTLAAQGPPTNRLSVLETAEALPIDESEYRERLRRGQLGENIVSTTPEADGTTAEEPSGASESRLDSPLDRGVLGGVLGLLVGVGIALVREQLDTRLRNREEAEDAFGWPVLAEVPALSRSQQQRTEVLARNAPLSRAAEAYRAVRTSLIFQRAVAEGTANGAADTGDGGDARSGRSPRKSKDAKRNTLVVMVASPGPGEGKTTTAANLAAIFAESGSTVLVVNCDFRRPRVHRYLGREDEPRRIIETDIPGVRLVSNVMADPAANPTAVVDAQRRTVDAARNAYDVIILDTAALLATSDALELLPAADAVVIVARDRATTRADANRAYELLSRLNAPIAGIVFVGAQAAPDSKYYYYSREASRQLDHDRKGAVATAAGSAGTLSAPLGTTAARTPADGTPPTNEAPARSDPDTEEIEAVTVDSPSVSKPE
jgi:Mrp family chromosome partitioning ATPase